MKLLLVTMNRKSKSKLSLMGNTSDMLTMGTVVVNALIEKVSKEKNLSRDSARAKVLELMQEGLTTLE